MCKEEHSDNWEFVVRELSPLELAVAVVVVVQRLAVSLSVSEMVFWLLVSAWDRELRKRNEAEDCFYYRHSFLSNRTLLTL